MFYNLETVVDVIQNNNYNSNHLMLENNKCIVDLKLHLNIDYDPERDENNINAIQINKLYEMLVAINFGSEAHYQIADFVLDTNQLTQVFAKEKINILIPDTATHINFIVLLRGPMNEGTDTWIPQTTKSFNV